MPCPCDSGLLYSKCCIRKNFRFEVDRSGSVRKRIEVHPRLKSVLEEAALEFKKILGRKPGPKDPVLFNHWLSGEEDFFGNTQGTLVVRAKFQNSSFSRGDGAASSLASILVN